MMRYNVLSIVRGTTVDGPGFRTSIYLAGCRHACPGCHNPQSWNPSAGTPYSLDEIMAIVEEEDFDVTVSGGDPMYNPEMTADLLRQLKICDRNIWVYTGFTWEEIVADQRMKRAISYADVVVDGPFVEALKDEELLFRGSGNQRIIDVRKSLKDGKPVLWCR